MPSHPDRVRAFAAFPDPISNWLYVEARDVAEQDGSSDVLISFNHAKITAPNEEGAYYAGRAAVQSANMTDTTGHAQGRFLNDYVVPV